MLLLIEGRANATSQFIYESSWGKRFWERSTLNIHAKKAHIHTRSRQQDYQIVIHNRSIELEAHASWSIYKSYW